jgi:hypothetical protein
MKELRPVPKPEKPERGTAESRRYLALVAQLPCVCCGRYWVDRHHPIHGRFARRKSSDLEVIPLCKEHHDMLHLRPAAWRALYGMDTDHIEPTRRADEALKGRTV